MPSWWNDFRSIIEAAYLISGPLLVAGLGIGLRQLKLTRELARRAATREAHSIAVEYCRDYLAQVIPSLDALDKAIVTKGVRFFDETQVAILPDRIEVQTPKLEHLQKLESVAPELAAALNRLEAFAVAFVTGVASETVAFAAVGHTFVSSVHKLLPAMVLIGGDHSFQHALQLYKLWRSREEAKTLTARIKKAESELGRLVVRRIPTIGAD
jgi:hypothetical protein